MMEADARRPAVMVATVFFILVGTSRWGLVWTAPSTGQRGSSCWRWSGPAWRVQP
jgi:hypothetical protein